MIDLHCHILSGIDDGAENVEESVQMARIAYEDGIRHIVATPHYTSSHGNTQDIVERKTAELREALLQEQIDIQLYSGCELRLESTQFVYEHIESGKAGYLADTGKFVLLEQRWKEYTPQTPEVVRWFLQRGVTPIIPHPERHPFFREDAALLLGLIAEGAWTQVSVDSLLGKNKEEARTFGEWLVTQGACHVLSTDAHNVRRRPNLSEGFAVVEQLAGIAQVQEMKRRAAQVIGLEQ